MKSKKDEKKFRALLATHRLSHVPHHLNCETFMKTT